MSHVATPSIPVLAPQSLADLGNQSIRMATGFLTAWMQDAGRMQQKLAQFFNERLEKDVTLAARFAQCTSPGAFIDLQLEQLTVMTTDYLDESQALLSLLGDAAQHGWDQASKAGAKTFRH